MVKWSETSGLTYCNIDIDLVVVMLMYRGAPCSALL